MKLKKAVLSDASEVCSCVQQTIKSIYPQYYSNQIVEFFCNLHCLDSIKSDIEKSNTYIVESKGKTIATGCMSKNHITRVYVLPENQKMGIGRMIMQTLENEIFARFDYAVLDTSLPAKHFYAGLGYKVVALENVLLNDNLIFEYEVMKKSNTDLVIDF